jgi:general secretion pathway protein J
MRGNVSNRRRTSGFTLMEVMVAIAIFALIGVASYRMLSAVAGSDERLARSGEQMATLNRALWLIGQDVEQLKPRPIRDAAGQRRPALLLDPAQELPLQLTRGGRANPLQLPRSSMQRVAWSVGPHPEHENPDSDHYGDEGRYLLRYVWPMLDGAGSAGDAQVQVVLSGVEGMVLAVRGQRSGVRPQWPGPDTENDRPVALQLILEHQQLGALERWYRLP